MIVLGHQNPDCDSLASAIGLASLLNKLGKNATAVLQGPPNPEGIFLLSESGIPTPEIRTSVKGEEIFLVDYSDWEQGVSDMKEAKIIGIVDHHKLGNITTSEPLECWIWPVGCSATIVYNMYKFHQKTVDSPIAKMLMGAIISDTVNFQGPTTTELDNVAASELAEIAGVDDLGEFAATQFEVKSDIQNIEAAELVLRDQKVFTMHNAKLAIAQLELTSLDAILLRKEELLIEMQKLHDKNNYHSTMVLLTDINKLNTTALILSEQAAGIAKSLGSKLEKNLFELPGVVSRKKQIIPFLESFLES